MDINDIVPFKDHTFKIRHDAEMITLMDSIKNNGVMEPIIAFVNEDNLVEQVTGHRRVYACQELGIEKVPVLIKDINRDEATIIMGTSNIERRVEILPSEKAATFKIMLDAMNRQGRRSDIYTSGETELIRSDVELAKILKTSSTQIYRYIALNNLIPELLELVDQNIIALRPAVELSYLPGTGAKENYQKVIYDYYTEENSTPNHAQAIKIRKLQAENLLTKEDLLKILQEQKPNQKVKSFKISEGLLNKYFDGYKSDTEIEEVISKAMELYIKQEKILKNHKEASNDEASL